jgi:NAD-dependent deacetylase
MSLDQKIQQAAALIAQARYIVAMTGAGISTPSGIPDFRSPSSGLWDQTNPLAVASIFAFRHSPQDFYNWVRPLSKLLLDAQPNPAHYALVALEKEGKLKAVITQNIDDLHGKAGSQTVYELHGHLREVTCTRCYTALDSAEIFAKFVQDGQVPKHHCGGVLKPNVILFGEQLPAREFVQAQLAVKEADLMLVAGSSLEVAPASDLPQLALENGAKLIIVNYQPTYLDQQADLVIQANVADILPRIVDLIQV